MVTTVETEVLFIFFSWHRKIVSKYFREVSIIKLPVLHALRKKLLHWFHYMNCVFYVERNSHVLMITVHWPLADFALPQFIILFTFNMQNLRSIVRQNCHHISNQIAIVLVFALK